MPDENQNLPPCAFWKIWRGQEIEGKQGVGQETLFIREFFPNVKSMDITPAILAKMNRNGHTKRVWFCKEFTDWEMIRELAKGFEVVCLEVNHRTFNTVPWDVRRLCVLYYKVKAKGLKRGDHICAGEPFRDEAFVVGEGVKVTTSEYMKDIKIL